MLCILNYLPSSNQWDYYPSRSTNTISTYHSGNLSYLVPT